MASSSSLGNASLANATTAQAFYTQFRQATCSLLTQVSSGEAPLDDALSRYAKLSVELTSAVDSGVLPSHDQGVHKRALEEIGKALEDRRRAAATDSGKKKPGFAFKRSRPVATSAAANTAVATTSAADSKRSEEMISVLKASSGDVKRSNHVCVASVHNARIARAPSPARDNTQQMSIDVNDISGSLIDLRPLGNDCTIRSVQIRSVTDSIILLPRVEGSVMVHHLHHSFLSIPSCHQFRMHDSKEDVVEITTKRGSVVTVEACQMVKFVTKQDGIEVQDFDDLINSSQLKHNGEGGGAKEDMKANFDVVVHQDADTLTQQVEELARPEGAPMRDCIDKIFERIA